MVLYNSLKLLWNASSMLMWNSRTAFLVFPVNQLIQLGDSCFLPPPPPKYVLKTEALQCLGIICFKQGIWKSFQQFSKEVFCTVWRAAPYKVLLQLSIHSMPQSIHITTYTSQVCKHWKNTQNIVPRALWYCWKEDEVTFIEAQSPQRSWLSR